jgi:flavin prenyltransferase
MRTPRRLVIGISGASGAMLGLRIIEVARAAAGWEIHLVVSRAAERTIAHEVGAKALTQLVDTVDKRHDVDDVGASIASGSFRTEAMIVAPCSMRSLGAIASSVSDNLLTRAAEVHLKERRRLVLMARETPLHLGHLRAMVKVTEIGAIVMPPVPAFYAMPATVDDIVDQLARRALALALPQSQFAGFEWTA